MISFEAESLCFRGAEKPITRYRSLVWPPAFVDWNNANHKAREISQIRTGEKPPDASYGDDTNKTNIVQAGISR